MRKLTTLAEGGYSASELIATMSWITIDLGFDYFAIAQHADLTTNANAIRVHNYPPAWVEYYEAHALAVSDPVHRASHNTSIGFRWSRIPAMIRLTPTDCRILDMARSQGIRDGFTVPAHVPGEARGSCSFAVGDDSMMSSAVLQVAQLAGAFAFEAARRLWLHPRASTASHRSLTDRQRDSVLWIARGKSDWEAGQILGISEETVTSHIRRACERYAVNKRISLVVRTLFDGTISFPDVLAPRNPSFRE